MTGNPAGVASNNIAPLVLLCGAAVGAAAVSLLLSRQRRNTGEKGSPAGGDVSKTSTDRSSTHQKSARKVLVLPQNDSLAAERDFEIDSDDYHVLCELLMASGIHGDDLEAEAREISEVQYDDDERRVYKLRLSCNALTESKIASLPPSIARLENLKDLDLSYTNNLKTLPKEIGDLAMLDKLDLHQSNIRSLPASIGRLHNLKSLNLSGTLYLSALPEDVGNLTNLSELDLSHSGITTLPSSIGRLRRLLSLKLVETTNLIELPKEIGDLESLNILSISCCSDLKTIPEEIGNLANLKVLYLWNLMITSLHPSIGRLQKLKYLRLSWMKNLLELPEEIGSLVSLKELSVDNSNITSLPCSIGKLTNLTDLDLSSTKNLSKLPDETGELASLEKLDLRRSGITSLPASITNLQSLKDLDLAFTEHLLELPREIGNLTSLKELHLWQSSIRSLPFSIGNLVNLKILNIQNSGIAALPDSVVRLTGLQYLDLRQTGVLKLQEDKDPTDFLVMLVHRCRSLVFLGVERLYEKREVMHALACNRARYRIGFGTSDNDSIRISPKLWPVILCNATRAFDSYPLPDIVDNGAAYNIRKPEAIYQLLADGRESFIGIIVDRNTNDCSAGPKGT